MTEETERNERKGDPMAMSLERFRAVLDAYGAAPDRWPVEERQSALDLIEHSPDARRAREEAAVVDFALDDHPAPPAAFSLKRRLEDIHAEYTSSRPRRMSRSLWARWPIASFGSQLFRPAYAGLAAAVLVIGFGMGLLTADLASEDPATRLAYVDEDFEPVADVYAGNEAVAYSAGGFDVADLDVTVRPLEFALLPTEPGSDLAELPIE